MSIPENVEGVTAQHLRFMTEAPAGATTAWRFHDPVHGVAIIEEAALADMMVLSEAPELSVCHLLHVQPGSAAPYEWRTRAEDWVLQQTDQTAPPAIDMLFQNERLLWRPGRAVFFGASERLAEIMPGLLHFVFLEGELRRLEAGIEACWGDADAHVPLTHQVDRHALRQWPEVNRKTELLARFRLRFARLEPALDKIPPWLTGPARRLAAECNVQAAVTDRLLAADDKIEALQDVYELANDRLSEFSYFSQEFWLEVGIVVILALELLAVVWWRK
jgi:hypothetical protein